MISELIFFFIIINFTQLYIHKKPMINKGSEPYLWLLYLNAIEYCAAFAS